VSGCAWQEGGRKKTKWQLAAKRCHFYAIGQPIGALYLQHESQILGHAQKLFGPFFWFASPLGAGFLAKGDLYDRFF
jgi:hypothetical protein